MDKYEIIFAIIIVVSYIISSIALKIPLYIHLIFGSVILGVLVLALLLKIKQKYKSERNDKIFKIALAIIFVLLIISYLFENTYGGILAIPTIIFMVILLIGQILILLDG